MSYGTVQAEKMTTESGYSLGAGNASSFKNRVINPGMVIDQRGGGTALTVAPSNSVYYGIDRYQVWSFPVGAAGTWTWQQQSATPPVGFTYYGRATVTTPDTSVATNDFYTIQQPIEGYNLADFGFGTANAKPFTVSFWVRSSLTGTFSCAISFGASGQGYALTYTINAANTWEFKTVNFPALTSSSILPNNITNGVSLYLIFALGLGSNFTTTAGTLGAAVYGVTGATNLISTNGATLDITGVQLEVGTVATSFDYRSYGTELALCQRYYQHRIPSWGTPRPSDLVCHSAAYYKVTMRTNPTLTLAYNVYGQTPVSIQDQNAEYYVTFCQLTASSSLAVGFNASAEL